MIAIGLIIMIVTFIVSLKGFNDSFFYDRYSFSVERILVYKEYYRLVTSGFLHVNWWHLIWNMISLYAFSGSIEMFLGPFQFLLIYFSGIIAGDLFTLFVHRHHSDYNSVGASGGICGIIFASVAIFPGMKIGFFLLPLSIPAWIFGLVFVLFSIYGIHSRNNNVGHEAHLAGALIGMLIGIAFVPAALTENYLPVLLIAVPSIVFIYMIITRPHVLLIDNNFFKAQKRYYSIDQKYNAEKLDKEKEVDRILEKISKKGIKSLTQKERETLENHSKTVR